MITDHNSKVSWGEVRRRVMLIPYHGIDPLPKSFSLVRKWSVVRGYICSCNSKGEKGEEEQQGSIALVERESHSGTERYTENFSQKVVLLLPPKQKREQ